MGFTEAFLRCDTRWTRAMRTREIPFTEEVLIWVRHHGIRAVWYNLYKFIGNSWTFVERKRKYRNELRVTLHHCNQIPLYSQKVQPLYNFAVEKANIVRQIACRIAKVEPSSTSAMALLRQLHGVRDGCDLGISRFRGCRIACRIAKKLLLIPL